MNLSDLLKKENNNLDIFRLLAAFLVIYGHAPFFYKNLPSYDFVWDFLKFDYSGSLAVKIFFFLSGLVVTNSLVTKGDIFNFLVSRFFRIWPALIAVLVVTAFVLAPFFSKENYLNYASSASPWTYVLKNIFMQPVYEINGASLNGVVKSLNGSLWSIAYEVEAYILLCVLFAFGINKNKTITSIVFLLIILDPLFDNKILFTWRAASNDIDYLAPCFAFGSILALWKSYIRINLTLIISSVLLYVFFRKSSYSFYFFYFSFFLSLIYISSLDILKKIRLPFDPSYGVYLWGWPIQLVISLLFYDYGINFNRIAAMLISFVIGVISWYVIEKKFINIGFSVVQKISWKNRIASSVYGK